METTVSQIVIVMGYQFAVLLKQMHLHGVFATGQLPGLLLMLQKALTKTTILTGMTIMRVLPACAFPAA